MVNRIATIVVCVGGIACASPQKLQGPDTPLAGAWRTAPIPSGSGIDFTLNAPGGVVSGTGHAYSLMYLANTLTVQGRQDSDGAFRLTITFDNQTSATYDGAMVGADTLDGTWTTGGNAIRMAFYRQAQ